MSFDLGTLSIGKLMVHDVPSPKDGGADPTLSEVESEVTTELRNYFQERIRDSLAHGAYEVRFLKSTSSPVPELTHGQVGKHAPSLVTSSQEMARHLHSSQTAAISSGLLIVFRGTIDSLPCLGVLKIEREEGLRAREKHVDGKLTFDMQHLHDLLLTQRTRVFKAGVFKQAGTSVRDIEGLVSDKQRGYLPKTEVANFFLKQFLGCELLQAPDVTTRHFFEAAESFVNNEATASEHKGRYAMAVVAELRAESATVRPMEFAERNLVSGDRARFEAKLAEVRVPTTQFDKDVAQIESRLPRIEYSFEGGVSLMGTPEALEEHVTMKAVDDGKTQVSLTDRIAKIRGRR